MWDNNHAFVDEAYGNCMEIHMYKRTENDIYDLKHFPIHLQRVLLVFENSQIRCEAPHEAEHEKQGLRLPGSKSQLSLTRCLIFVKLLNFFFASIS